MLISNNKSNTSIDFKLSLNHNVINRTNSLKYLRVTLDNKLSWKTHVDNIVTRLSRVCGVIYKLRHLVPTSTLKLVYYSMFNSTLQYFLINWGKACKTHLQKISVLQNKIIRACLFCPKYHPTVTLYSKFEVLRLEDMINMEFAKFVFKYSNKMLPKSFDSYFIKLDLIHNYNTRRKSKNEFFHDRAITNKGRMKLHHIYFPVWEKIPLEDRNVSFYKFKKLFKAKCLAKYVN